MSLTILQGDALEQLRKLKAESVHCCVTSPPYWSLRDYACDGQIGVESTPEEYVDKIVFVFKEVRRVLRNDGTLWLNLGDSYCSQGGLHDGREDNQPNVGASRVWRNGSGRADGIVDERGQRSRNGNSVIGLKPKDLVGIPWRVARALQEPYYTGKIKDERDRVWLAAMIDAEGCMFIHKRKTGQANGQGYERKNDSYGACLEVANTNELITKRCLEITGRGSVFRHEKDRRQPLFRWSMRSNECREVIREVYPYLVGKQHEARLLLGCPSSGNDAEAAHAALIELHNGRPANIDFPAPKSLYEQGWYLRSDVIWSKLNPMPESVTDRPTKSHEYLFLLTKSASYFYDAEAIKERCEVDDIRGARTFGNGGESRAMHRDNGRLYTPDGNGRNKRSVWTIATQPYPEAHFATFPPDLIKPCILAGTSAKGCCTKCGAPWERITQEHDSPTRSVRTNGPVGDHGFMGGNRRDIAKQIETLDWQPTCHCEIANASHVASTVLDPFAGSGTTGMVALELGRKAVLIELNPKYVQLIEQRCDVTLGLALA